MISELKKYPKTYTRFSEYMGKFDTKTYCFDPDEITASDGCDGFVCKMPEQFLLGCLMEFALENKGYVRAVQGLVSKKMMRLNAFELEKQIVIKAFEILEAKRR